MDPRIPKVRVHVAQVQRYVGQRLVVVIDAWPVASQYDHRLARVMGAGRGAWFADPPPPPRASRAHHCDAVDLVGTPTATLLAPSGHAA